jgi:hypothetical protein
MEGRWCPEGMTPEQFEEAQRVFEVSRQAAEEELWRMACLTAGKKDGEMFGETEFQLRDIVLRIGARTLEAAVNERRKKGGTQAAVSRAVTASTTRASSTGGRKRS